ncbi:MAG: glycosyltransferase [Verrucomicrobiota bacterium]
MASYEFMVPLLLEISTVLAWLHLGLACLLALYALHSYAIIGMLLTFRSSESSERQESGTIGERWIAKHGWPEVVTQLPIYNEQHVARRIITAAAEMDYATSKHVVQVLDDSDDETIQIIDQVAEELNLRRAQGEAIAEIQVIRRDERSGFKAGALAYGISQTTAPFMAVFDADFIPEPDFLRRSIPHFFAADDIGFVQGRWTFLNHAEFSLTRAQGIGLDSHFAIEQGARSSHPNTFMNFNGTAGIWRAAAIEDAGGWSASTLTEDLELSYRTQMKGWQGVYLPDLEVPCELPASFSGFKSQQFRWAKGSIQTALRLYPGIVKSGMPLVAKIEAFFHLTHYLVHPLLFVLVLLTPATIFSQSETLAPGWAGTLLLAASFAPVVFYSFGQSCLHRNWLQRLIYLPALTLAGMGLALSNAKAVWEAVTGRTSPFIRTPKQGQSEEQTYWVKFPVWPRYELLLGGYTLLAAIAAWNYGSWGTAQFTLLASAAFLYMGFFSERELRGRKKPQRTQGSQRRIYIK